MHPAHFHARSWALALGVGVAAAGDLRADDVTLTYQAVVHTTETHAIPVEGQPERTFGIAAFRGLAIFEDGRIANHWYGGHFDFAAQSGPFAGHALWVFEDGSTLRAAYTGEGTATPDGGLTFTGSHGEFSGTGAYEGVSGSGRFEGHRVDHLDDGGDTYYRGELELSLP